ncbi:hypothetical protein INT43_004476 [Umbelopsis isabellina]|uniref:FAD/NAD(P)-binding domain-containing protein n=1 Tax=Mortierella isabellina TaxID=91625 RepID=A0A8H7PFS5_MORIS|nr:hypothetical protein INT43_004476 [Umbelopsis isabellina]
MEKVDLVVIGAGVYGLAAAKTYLEVNSDAKVVVLDANSTVGGVWSKDRMYKGLKSNNLLGTLEFSDFSLDPAKFDVKPGEHIPGEALNAYLVAYAEHFGFAEKIRLNSKVETVTHQKDGSWKVAIENSAGSLITRKLIVATGLTSCPYLPEFKGQEMFQTPLFHYRDMPNFEKDLLQDGKRATVLGGGKSAWDTVYSCASSGLQVDWVIRESGHGPVWMAPPYVTPLKKWLEKLVTTRFLTWFSPCVWGHSDGYGFVRSLLHGTWIGRKIVDAFWRILEQDLVQLNGYDNHPETKKLMPWTPSFWTATSLSILNYPTDFFEYVRNGTVRIHIADIKHLTSKTVHLSTDEELPTDALICSTGWRCSPAIKFLPEGIENDLGLPWSKDKLDEQLLKDADDEILHRFPRLRDQPTMNPKYKPLSKDSDSFAPHPFRLARFMIPLPMIKERSIAFVGFMITIDTSILAQTQALWTTAFFSDKLSVVANAYPPSKSDKSITKDEDSGMTGIEWETALHTQFCKWRYPGGYGKRYPDFVFDAIPYFDLLLKDLGLPNHRKKGHLAEIFSSYGPEDYRGLTEEWLAINQ